MDNIKEAFHKVKEDIIKEAFHKVKEDINSVSEYIRYLESRLEKTEGDISHLASTFSHIDHKLDLILKSKITSSGNISEFNPSTHNPTQKPLFNLDKQPTDTPSTHNPTQKPLFKTLNDQLLPTSIGNEGVPTDRQTDQQTDNNPPISNASSHNPLNFKQIQHENQNVSDSTNYSNSLQKSPQNVPLSFKTTSKFTQSSNSFKDASKILDSLDDIKKDLRRKFKKLTDQEFLVFSTLYQLEEEIGYGEYRIIADRLNLTESSIRDYVGRLIRKGVPIEKEKINNKSIKINLSQDLKKIASLQTIMQLRGI